MEKVGRSMFKVEAAFRAWNREHVRVARFENIGY